MSMKISHNDISTSQISRIAQGEKAKDVMSLWSKIKDWFQSNKRERALKIVENIVSKEQFDKNDCFKMVYQTLMLKTMASNSYKERIKISINDGWEKLNNKNITVLIDDYNIFFKDIDDKQIEKISTIINIFEHHSSIFSNEIALESLYKKLNEYNNETKNNDLLFAELYLELDNKIKNSEINLDLSKNNFNKVDFYGIRQNINEITHRNNNNLDIRKALKKDINRDTYIVNGEKIKSRDQEEAMQQFESLIKDLSEKNKKAIYYLLNQEGITLIKSYNDTCDYYTLTTSFSGENVSKQEKVYNVKNVSGDLIEVKIKYLKKSNNKINNNIPLAKAYESKLYNFIHDMIVTNNHLKPNDDKTLNMKIQNIKDELNKKESNLGELFLDQLYRSKIINEDSIDITLKLDQGELVSLDGECLYRFY